MNGLRKRLRASTRFHLSRHATRVLSAASARPAGLPFGFWARTAAVQQKRLFSKRARRSLGLECGASSRASAWRTTLPVCEMVAHQPDGTEASSHGT
jgi:hypothetical protein